MGGDTSLGNDVAQKYKTFQDQEFTEDLGLNTYEFNFRMHDPAIGRFWQIDPLAEDYSYQSPYNFAENRVIDSRELEGLEAWQSTRNWTDADIERYSEYAAQRAEEYRQNGTNCTCEDLAFNVLIDFASENELPIQLSNADGTLDFDSNSVDYDNVEDFKEDALSSLGAIDVATNSEDVSKDDIKPGDTIFDSQVSHIQVVTDVTDEEITIHQGNLGFGWSANPTSIGYKGVDVQTGVYDRETGDYQRTQSNSPRISGYLNEVSALRWLFNNWKK